MVTKEKRRASALTLADKSAELKRYIFEHFGPASAGISADSLPDWLTAPLPARMPEGPDAKGRLGPPLDLKGVARLIGCSPWTVRQKLIPLGLPHFQPRASGKLIFYEAQVIRWIHNKQNQGGKRR